MYTSGTKWKFKRDFGMLIMAIAIALVVQAIVIWHAVSMLLITDFLYIGALNIAAVMLFAVVLTEYNETRSARGVNVDFLTFLNHSFLIFLIYIASYLLIIPSIQFVFNPVDYIREFSNEFIYFGSQVSGMIILWIFNEIFNE